MKWIKADVKPDFEKYKNNYFIMRIDEDCILLCTYQPEGYFTDEDNRTVYLEDFTHYLILEEPKND